MLTDEEIEKRATSLRKALGIEGQLRPDMMTVIQKTKHSFKKFGYLRVPDDDMPDAEAQWDSDKGILSLRESVFRAMQRDEPRARMTVAHELGHFALKHEGVRNRSLEAGAAEKYLEWVRRDEREAKRFAAAFLAPADFIREDDTAEDIAERFGLSAQAAEIRKSEVEAMRRRAAGHSRDLPSAVLDFLREAQRRGLSVRTKLD